MRRIVIIIFLISCPVSFVYSQIQKQLVKPDSVKSLDLKQVIKNIFKSKSTPFDTLTLLKTKSDFSLSILPGISYNPATDVIFGVSLSASWFAGDIKNTTNSAVISSVSYSTKKQFKLSIQSNIYTNKNNWSFQGDWRLWNYVQYTYGLGTGTPNSNAQNMNFQFIRFNENFLKKIKGRLFAGIGYSLEYYKNIETVDSSDNALYPNIQDQYSALHGLDSTQYISSGFVLNTAYDSRDNTINPYKGVMMQANYYNYNTALGSSSNWQKFYLEGRAYHNLRDNENPYILAFWFMGNAIINGNVPYMSLPAIGWDKYNSSGRGYVQGRWRGMNMLYAEFENRINLTRNGFLGMVIFTNAITLSNSDTGEKLFDYIDPALGMGLRIKFDTDSRTNIGLDYAFGKDGSKGFFLTLGEVF